MAAALRSVLRWDGIYLWLFSSNRCSSKTSVRIRQLWKYLWAEKCKTGSNTEQWPGPHPPEVCVLFGPMQSGLDKQEDQVYGTVCSGMSTTGVENPE